MTNLAMPEAMSPKINVPLILRFLFYFILFLVIIVIIPYSTARFLGVTFQGEVRDYISAISIIFSAILAGAFAATSIVINRETAKMQETLKFISAAELDREFIDAKNAWSKYRATDEGDEELAQVISIFYVNELSSMLSRKVSTSIHRNADQRERRSVEIEGLEENYQKLTSLRKKSVERINRDVQYIITYLNRFELIALSIKHNIIDEKFYREWHGTTFVETWNHSIPAINAMRAVKNNDKLFECWFELASKWSKEKDKRLREPKSYNLRHLAKMATEQLDSEIKSEEIRQRKKDIGDIERRNSDV